MDHTTSLMSSEEGVMGMFIGINQGAIGGGHNKRLINHHNNINNE